MVKSITDTTILNNGLKMPWFGLGVFKVPEGEVTVQSVSDALEAGYRSIDTAALYHNERGVGQAMRASGIPREQIFLTTKVWNDDLRAQRTPQAFEESLDRLEVEYVDLYLIHWPVKGFYKEAWKAMEGIYHSGRAKAIGVSNFKVHHLQDILSDCEIAPAVDQVEFHPYLYLKELLDFCKANKIQLEAWAPIAKGQVASDERIQMIAGRYHHTPAQVVLRWELQHGIVVIPKSTHKERILENAGVFDFELSDEDMNAIDALNEDRRLGADPDTFDF